MKLEGGKHAGKTFEEIQTLEPSYLLWLAGIRNIVSLKYDPTGEKYLRLCAEHPEVITAAKDWVEGKCLRCWTKMDHSKHNCPQARAFAL